MIWLSAMELHLFIRHPSGVTTDNPKYISDSKVLSVVFAREIIHASDRLISLNFLESTWLNVAIILTSIFTIFYGVWAKDDPWVTEEEISQLKRDIDAALRIIDLIAAVLDDNAENNTMKQTIALLSNQTIRNLQERNFMIRKEHEQQQRRNSQQAEDKRAGRSIASILNNLQTTTYLSSSASSFTYNEPSMLPGRAPAIPSNIASAGTPFASRNSHTSTLHTMEHPVSSIQHYAVNGVGASEVLENTSTESSMVLGSAANFTGMKGPLRWSDFVVREMRAVEQLAGYIHKANHPGWS